MSSNLQKRQRPAGSFTPETPSNRETKPISVRPTLPHTPPSPTFMSPTQPNGNTASITVNRGPEFTPPSSVGRSPQFSQQPIATAPPMLLTPTDSISQKRKFESTDSDEDGRTVKQQKMNDGVKNEGSDVAMSDTSRTVVEREGQSTNAARASALVARNGDMGSYFCLSQQPFPRAQPHGSQDFFALYNLENVAMSVARKDPVTGEKINKLRKSYETHAKELGLPGKNKPQPKERDIMELFSLAKTNEWRSQIENGKFRHVEEGLSKEVMDKLDLGALRMNPGKLSGLAEKQFRHYTASGDDGAKPKASMEATGKNPLASMHGNPSSAHPSATASPALKPSRPARQGTKRRYDDSSYKGYGEGYADDALSSDGGEDSRNGSKKRRRKDFLPSGSPLSHERPGSFNVGMVGARR